MSGGEIPFVRLYIRLTVRRVLREFGETTDDPDEGIGCLWESVL